MYEYLDAAVVRVAVWEPESDTGPWPDLTGRNGYASWRPWLRRVTRIPGFAAAVEHASPVLARRVREICAGREVSERTARRAVLSVMRYLLRASGRATPFGRFAGVAPARIAAQAVIRAGSAHGAVTRADAGWLAAAINDLEAVRGLQPRLTVLANDLVFERDGELVLEHRPAGRADEAPTLVRVRGTEPIRAAMNLARHPIHLGTLAERLAADFPGTPADRLYTLLDGLVTQRLLLTNLRPSMTVSDPLGHLVGQLQTMTAEDVPEVTRTVEVLRELVDGSAPPPDVADSVAADVRPERLEAATGTPPRVTAPAQAVDLRMDWELTVPHAVMAEAAQAATILVRLAGRRSLNPGWDAWHARFLERYGPNALVPVIDAVDPDLGIGYPAGYLGGAATPPPRSPTDRDARLLALAQNAALRHQAEIVLDEALVADLADRATKTGIQATTELTVSVHAPSQASLNAGDFTLTILGVSRTAGTMTGRFLDLFDAADRERMAAAYAGRPTTNRDALTVQISAPPLYPNTENVARAPRVMAHVLHVGEYHDDSADDPVRLDDIAVTADADRIYLVSRSRRRPVEPVMLSAVEPTHHLHPLVRFLTEATSALSVPCTAFDWGAAADLPFLPGLRFGRTVISPARWRLAAADLPGPAAIWHEWNDALTTWQNEVALPQRVYLGDGDQRIALDLTEPAHRALLRAQLERTPSASLRAAPEPDTTGWNGGHTCEIVVPLAATNAPASSPPCASDVTVSREHGHMPAAGDWLYLKLYGRPGRQDDILVRYLPHLMDELGDQVSSPVQWWFVRYQDPEDHLRLRLAIPDGCFAPIAAAIGAWSGRLRRAGLVSRVQWDTYFPETNRFGGSTAMDAAHAYFVADSAAALAELASSKGNAGLDLGALTAASLLDITIGWLGDADQARSWLVEHVRAVAQAPARQVYDQAVDLANPDNQDILIAQSGGERVVSCWAWRRKALAAYRSVLDDPEAAVAGDVLPDLLHLHYARTAGPDLTGERTCLHLARAAALSWTARAKKKRS